MSLHDKIIDIPPSRTDSQGYLIGHRDARHAAAELAAEADAQIAALQAECKSLRHLAGMYRSQAYRTFNVDNERSKA